MSSTAAVAESLKCAMEQPGFFDRFYQHLFRAAPELKPMFQDVDMEVHNVLLRKGIVALLMHVAGSSMGTKELDHLRETHGIYGLNITEDMYRIWINTMIRTVRDHSKEFDHKLEAAWRDTLEQGIRYVSE